MSSANVSKRACPFCQSDALVEMVAGTITYGDDETVDVYRAGWIECMQCSATGPVRNVVDGFKLAWKAWNDRKLKG